MTTQHERVLAAYIEAALWASVDQDGDALDRDYSASDLSPEARAKLAEDVTNFLTELDRIADASLPDDGQLGHDLWLTRNGHGAGFWDRGLGALGDELTKLAHAAGERDLYVGDDGSIHTN